MKVIVMVAVVCVLQPLGPCRAYLMDSARKCIFFNVPELVTNDAVQTDSGGEGQ